MSQPKNIPGWTYKYFLGSHFWKCDINDDLQVIARDDCIDFDQKPGGLEITYILDKTIRPERCGWYVSFSDKGKGATSYPRAGTPTNGDFEWTRGPFTEEEALHWAEMLLLDWNFRKRNVYPKDYSMDIPGWVHETQYLSDLWRNKENMTYSFILKPVGGHRYEVWKYIQHPSKEEWLSKDRLEAMILGKKAGVERVKWYSEHTYVPKDPLHAQLDKYLEVMAGLSDAQIKDMLGLMKEGMTGNEAYKKVLGYPTDNPGHNPGHHAGNPGKFKYPISIAPSPGTYIMGHYADGSLDLMRVISEPRIHPARILKTTIDHHIPEHWDLEVEIPNSPPDSKGHQYLTPPVVADVKRANDEDFEAFIIEQKQNLMDVRKDYGPDPQRMADWFRRGIEVAYEWWKEFREKRGIDPPPPLSQVAPGGQRTLFNNLGNNEGENPLKGEKVWQMDASRYQLLMGVHQPWIAEISPAQYAGMSKRARDEYDKKRSAEWQASADIKNEWSEKVAEAYVLGEFKLEDPDVSKEAKDAVWAYERDLKEEREKTAFEKATSENRVQNIDELEIGDRVFTLMYREYGEVIKKFKKSVRIRWEKPLYGGVTESTLEVGYLQWWEYNDLVERAKGNLPIRPVRGPVQQPPAAEIISEEELILREGYHKQAGGLEYFSAVDMEIDYRKRGYDVRKAKDPGPGDRWSVFIKAKKEDQPPPKEYATLDDYLRKESESLQKKADDISLNEYLGNNPGNPGNPGNHEESDPEGRILFNTTCTLKDFGMEGAVGPKHYVALSGGKDSSAMLIRMLEIGMPVDHVLFADTGMEFPEIYAHLRNMDSWLQTNHNLNITWLKPKSTWDTWFYGAVTRGKMVGQRRGYPLFLFPCWWTREAKFKVMDPIIGCGNFRYIGFAADEPKRLKRKPGYRYPLAEWGWTEKNALEYLTDMGMSAPIHHKFNRTGCYLCPKQHVRSLTTLHDQYPDLWAIAKKYEADSPQGFRPDLKLSDIEEGRTKFKGPQEIGRFG